MYCVMMHHAWTFGQGCHWWRDSKKYSKFDMLFSHYQCPQRAEVAAFFLLPAKLDVLKKKRVPWNTVNFQNYVNAVNKTATLWKLNLSLNYFNHILISSEDYMRTRYMHYVSHYWANCSNIFFKPPCIEKISLRM